MAVSPFKATEAEQMVQYFKLKKKIAAGAAFVVTQLGYDARKFHEALPLHEAQSSGRPVVGNIYILPFGAGKVMNQNKIPGCVVTDKLVAETGRERGAADKGEGARLLRAARMYAIMKGMGFSGVHIGGHNLRYEQVEQVISEGEALSAELAGSGPSFRLSAAEWILLFRTGSEHGAQRRNADADGRDGPWTPRSISPTGCRVWFIS